MIPLLIQWVGGRLCFLGKQLNITAGLLIFDIIGTALNCPFPSLVHNVLNALANYVFLSSLLLLLLLEDGVFGFMRRPDIGIGVAIIMLLQLTIPGFLTTSFQYNFATLMYIIARSLMCLSFVLKQRERDWLSHLMAGVAYAVVTLGILGYIISLLPFDFACAGIAVLFFFAMFTWIMDKLQINLKIK